MDPEFWYQQHILDSDAHHLNNHMIDMARQYMRGDATRMETYIKLGSLVYEYKHCKGMFAQSKLTMDAIQCRFLYSASANSSNQTIKLLDTCEDVTIRLSTSLPILEGC